MYFTRRITVSKYIVPQGTQDDSGNVGFTGVAYNVVDEKSFCKSNPAAVKQGEYVRKIKIPVDALYDFAEKNAYIVNITDNEKEEENNA